jgi:2-amino-4-hydroxy-6-hydroxymethyldihydropteridine diphosphokinase
MPLARVAIGLGSNLGHRLTSLVLAVASLKSSLELVRCSAVYETEPMHREDQPLFLNACCVGKTALDAFSLLRALKGLERRAGRRPQGARYSPRELDLDLLLYADVVIEKTDLRVPHPRMAERPFVLWPLAEIAGDWIHPGTGQPIARMAADLPRTGLAFYAPPTFLTAGRP